MTDRAPDDDIRERERLEETTDATPVIDDAFIERITQSLDEGAIDEVERELAVLHSADLADLLEHLHPEDRATIVGIIKPTLKLDAEVLTHLDEEIRSQVFELLTPGEIAAALAELDSDDALTLIEGLEEEEREEILAALPVRRRLLVEEGLTFPEYSAGRLMQREYIAVPMFWTVGRTIDYLRAAEDLPDDFFLIFSVDPMHRPTGAVPLSRVLRSKRSVKIADLVQDEVRPIAATTDQEEVAYMFRQYGLVSAPVVDDSGRLIGVVTVDDVVDVIDEEAEDDLLKLGGVAEDDFYSAVLDTSRSRFSWLGLNLLTAILASGVIAIFEGTIEQIVALAVLMPIVASMGGNAGTQTLTVAVRALAMKELSASNARRVIGKELLVGSINGLAFAIIAGGITAVWFGDPTLALVIGAAMIINLVIAALSGTLIPLALDRFRIDPAVASGVFLTTVTDVVGFFAFLGLAAWVLI
ncbi:magnesium transporter [Inquilinus sp. CAU 1745]|uniref:magnesium transporter n=1 Tax=Inquilinus sp. CAU 1745 TaxID=3140369 RepID=UPI00325BD3D0